MVSVMTGSSEVTPDSAASRPSPTTFTSPVWLQRTEPGDRHIWATPAVCAEASAADASAMIRAALAGSSGPSASMSPSVSPAAHSITMYARSHVSSTSKTWASRGSVSLLAALAAVTTSVTLGKPVAKVKTVTARASVSSIAFQAAQPDPAAIRSSSRYRPPSLVPGSDA